MNLSYTKKFFLLALNEKGKIPTSKSTQIYGCLIAGGLMELLNGGMVVKDEKERLSVVLPLDEEFSYLAPLYGHLKDAKKPKTVEKLAMDYLSGGKHLEQLVSSFSESLWMKNYKDAVSNQGLFKNKTFFVPKEEAIILIIDAIREQFLREGELEDEMICLVSLLDESKLLSEYFGKLDVKKIHQMLTEMPASGTHALARKMIDETITMMVVMNAIIMS